MRFFVFRIAKGHAGGEPTNECPIEFGKLKDELRNELKNIKVEKINYEETNYIDFLHSELWKCKKLRQGWGLEGLDLELLEEKWIKNYIIGAKKYWGEEITQDYCEIAAGRYKILSLLKEAKKGDLIFIPKHSNNFHHDEGRFTVCKVIGSYYFDLEKKYKDFGHVLPVTDLRVFPYSEDTLLGKDFFGYRKALGEIKNYHKLYKSPRFKEFLKREFGINI